MVTIVDYGSGNLRSVQKAFERLGTPATITSDPNVVAEADRLVLPGVGAFGDAMRELSTRGLVEPIVAHVRADRPFFGICMGLQLLFETGWEGGRQAGLGLLAGDVARFDLPAGMKVPHMGWNDLEFQAADPMFAGLTDPAFVYFVHSYYPQPAQANLVTASCTHGVTFAASCRRGNVRGVQFHPEKSQETGLRMLENFVAELRSSTK